MAIRVKMFLLRTLRELTAIPTDQLLDQRYQKFRRIGVFLEDPHAPSPSGNGQQ
jgi:acetyl-CoA carboxylase carboxyl transferase subunit alpha